MNETRTARLQMIAAMLIFGTIGILRRFLPVSSALLAAVRGLLGAGCLLAGAAVRHRLPAAAVLRRHGLLLALSGALIGFNWILLFEAYKHTTVAVATLCYYMAPILVLLAAPLLLHEKLTAKKTVCIVLALLGMVPVAGVTGGEVPDPAGVALGLGAAVLYAAVILLNKRLTDVPPTDRTAVQLAAAGLAVLPYALLTEDFAAVAWSPRVLLLLAVAGLVHTALAYRLYFGAIPRLRAQSVALLGYLDPATAVLLSALVLHEPLTLPQGIGAVLILGAALLGEF